MIDGWFMWKRIEALNAFNYNGPNIRKYCLKHLRSDDYLYRIFYYDTEPLDKKGHHPITGDLINFGETAVAQKQRKLLESIKTTPNFALRLGETLWRNNEWILNADRLKNLLSKKITIDELVAEDVRPRIEQKAVDMKIGLDISLIAMKQIADFLIIITGDSDMVPALKHARREGMQVLLDPLRKHIRHELAEHVDFIDTKVAKPKTK